MKTSPVTCSGSGASGLGGHSSDAHPTRQNRLLAALPQRVHECLSSHLELIQMPLGDVLYEYGSELRHVYFPTTAIVSLLYLTKGGASAEITGVGNEGIVGVSTFTSGISMPNRAIVLCAGYAYRLKAQLLKDEFHRIGALQNLLLRYTQARMTQVSQNAVCNRHHLVEQQLSCWLLRNLDRSPSNELIMTQELIASVLGVRREGITEAAGKLQSAGFIRYRRGHITVLDRTGLEKRTCECYQVVKTEFDRLLPDEPAMQTSPFSYAQPLPICDVPTRGRNIYTAPVGEASHTMAIRDKWNEAVAL